jgi:hypothetical protein
MSDGEVPLNQVMLFQLLVGITPAVSELAMVDPVPTNLIPMELAAAPDGLTVKVTVVV